MYRQRTKGSQKFCAAMARARAEAKRLTSDHPDYGPDLPEIRRRIVVEDYDCGEIIRHEFVLFRSNRIDSYIVEVDGQRLGKRYGWARTLELVRKAFVRVGIFA